jgi:hypothetical protein
MSPFQPGAQKAPEPKPPAGLAGKVGHAARQRPPDPKGKGIVIALIAGAAVVAAIHQIATGGGAGKTVLEQRAKDARAAEERKTDLVAPRDPRVLPEPVTVTGRATHVVDLPAVEAPDETPSAPIVEAPEPVAAPPRRIVLPPGLGGDTAANLRLALGAIESGYTLGAVDLPRMVAAAHERERPIVRQVVVETLTRLAAKKSTRGLALDAALELTSDGQGGLEPIVAAAVAAVEEGDDTAAEALVFFAHLSAEEGAAGVEAVTHLVEEELRQLHLRVLAAQVLVRWDVALAARKALAAEASTPTVLREALDAP